MLSLKKVIHVWLVPNELFVRHNKKYSLTTSEVIFRRLLSQYIGQIAKKIPILHNKYGKPFIDHQIKFNISHRGDWHVFSFVRDAEIGVDVECVQPIDDLFAFAKFVLPADHANLIMKGRSDVGLWRFYKYWTQCEAYSKLVGRGLFDFFDLHRIISFNVYSKTIIFSLNYILTVVCTKKMSVKVLLFEDNNQILL